MTIRPALQHMGEPLNHRALFLRFRGLLWIVPAATVAGALLGTLIYSLIWLSFSGQRQYQQTSKYYLTFGYEENGDPADYYNAYTWNDLIFSIPSIAEVIEDELPDGVSMEEAQEAIEADILSDVRVLTIEVTHSDPTSVQQMTNAVEDALIRYGKNAIQFENIEFLSSTEVEAVIISDRTRNAVLLGAVLGLLISAAWLWIHELLDDGIYTPEDAVRRYGIPVCAALPAEGTRLPEFLQAESDDALQALAAKGAGAARLVSADTETAKAAARQLQEQYKIRLQAVSPTQSPGPETAAAGVEDSAAQVSENADAGIIGGAQMSADTILVIPFGQANGTRTEHLIEHLRAQGTEINSILLFEADGRFLSSYYGTGKAGQQHKAAKGGT